MINESLDSTQRRRSSSRPASEQPIDGNGQALLSVGKPHAGEPLDEQLTQAAFPNCRAGSDE